MLYSSVMHNDSTPSTFTIKHCQSSLQVSNGASSMPHCYILDSRIADIITYSQESFMTIRHVDTHDTLHVGDNVFPRAFFEHQLSKGFSCLTYVERFAAPTRRKQADILQMGTGINTDILRLKHPFVAIFVGLYDFVRVKTQKILAHTRDERRIEVVIVTAPSTGSPVFSGGEVADK